MVRRSFLQLSPVALLAGTSACATTATIRETPFKLLKGERLRPGNKVRLICPAGPISESRLQKAITNMESLGLEVELGQYVLEKRGFNAGTDEQRLTDLHDAFRDPTVDAIWAIRGGYGATRLLPMVDFELVRANPKLLIGYSDITALLLAFYQRTGLVGIHGPVASSDFTDFNLSQFKPVAVEGVSGHTILAGPEGISLVGGRARGPLVGGNLTLLAAMAGTPYGLDAKGKIVFIEDVGEDPYRIDRMLTQLRQSARLDEAKGIVLGEFVGCEADPEDNSLTLLETLEDRLKGLGLPLVYRYPFGHGDLIASLPMGIMVELDADAGQLRLLEAAVTP